MGPPVGERGGARATTADRRRSTRWPAQPPDRPCFVPCAAQVAHRLVGHLVGLGLAPGAARPRRARIGLRHCPFLEVVQTLRTTSRPLRIILHQDARRGEFGHRLSHGRPPVRAEGDMASNATAELAPESGPTADRLVGDRRCWTLLVRTGALSMALLALSDQPAAEVTEGANQG